jgi:hypothetical protein
MHTHKFFTESLIKSSESKPAASIIKAEIIQSTDIEFVLSHAEPGSLVILDIDDTIGRVPQTIGLDAWFRFRLQQYSIEGHAQSTALLMTIEIYNQAQLASTEMVFVDKSKNIATLINQLKEQGVTVIGLTARNHVLTDKTLSLLDTLGVSFSQDVLKDGSFMLKDKLIEIKNGVIFSDGSDKGVCFEHVLTLGYFQRELSSFVSVDFVDDSERNCHAVRAAFERLNIAISRVWHYPYAELFLAFGATDQKRASIQEQHLLEHKTLLTDEEADTIICARTSSPFEANR